MAVAYFKYWLAALFQVLTSAWAMLSASTSAVLFWPSGTLSGLIGHWDGYGAQT